MAQQTHTAVVTVAPGAPLSTIEVPTLKPEGNEVRVLNQWTCSTPLDLHQNDSHLLVTAPQILGDGVAGRVVEIGPEVKNLKIGDEVFGFTWRSPKEKAFQQFVIAPENLLGKIPSGFSKQQVVTVPNNFITILNVIIIDFGMNLPWPKPNNYIPEHADEPILIWGGSSSTGMYALQLLKWLGYTNLITVASAKHHAKLQQYGAGQCFDYRGGVENTVQLIIQFQNGQKNPIRYVLDCIGSLGSSLRPISRIARTGAKVSVLLPVIIKDAAVGVKPEYSMDVQGSADWAQGVETRGVRTHFYLDSPLLAEKGQSEIMPAALELGIIEPNEQLIVEGNTLLERAEKALSMLRNKEVSGQRLVWRIADEVEA